MLYHAMGGTVALPGADMDYIVFGSGENTLIMLPGLADGLRTVRGTAIPFAWMYRAFAKRFRVYVFSRRNGLPVGFTTRDMAADVKHAMDALGISAASVMGVSQGGMIAQFVAADYPDAVEKLVLAVTAPCANDTMRSALNAWISMAENGDYQQLMQDTALRSYSDAYLKKNRLLLSLAGKTGKPKSFERFLIEARSCLSHDAYAHLSEIACPTLILGGEQDKIVGADASRTLADRIPDSCLHLYADYGHAAYEEAADFNKRVIEFLSE